MAFVQGMGRDCYALGSFCCEDSRLIMCLYISPMMVAHSCGNIVKIMAYSNRLF